MTTTAVDPQTHPGPPDFAGQVLHIFCCGCWPIPQPGNVAFCGHVSTTGANVGTDLPTGAIACVVCEDLHKAWPRCPKCGIGG